MRATSTRTARKVLGSLGVIGAAAAVAGMGTFGTFTDSTAPLNASVTSGTLKLNLTAQNGVVTLPTMTASNFVPGDSMSRPVDLTNAGNLAMGSISLNSTATTGSVLTTDKVNGLQLNVSSCPVNWTESAPGSGVWSCSSAATTVVASGAAVTTAVLANPASVNPTGTDHLLVTITLPTAADNTFQGKSAALSVSFTATQRTGTNR